MGNVVDGAGCLPEVISEMRRAGRASVQRDFASTRAYEIGFSDGVEAVLDVLEYAGLVDDPLYLLYEVDVNDADRVAKLLVRSWEQMARELAGGSTG
jgi:hypothetical protein